MVAHKLVYFSLHLPHVYYGFVYVLYDDCYFVAINSFVILSYLMSHYARLLKLTSIRYPAVLLSGQRAFSLNFIEDYNYIMLIRIPGRSKGVPTG